MYHLERQCLSTFGFRSIYIHAHMLWDNACLHLVFVQCISTFFETTHVFIFFSRNRSTFCKTDIHGFRQWISTFCERIHVYIWDFAREPDHLARRKNYVHNILQHNASHCNVYLHRERRCMSTCGSSLANPATCRDANLSSQHIATHCNTLHRTAIYMCIV